MDDYVLNEYVHVDQVYEWPPGRYKVDYEPFDFHPIVSTLDGHVVFAATQARIHFRQGSHVILVDSDTIIDARIKVDPYFAWRTTSFISMIWDRFPEEHFLTVSYTIGDTEPPASYIPKVPERKVAWLKEGF